MKNFDSYTYRSPLGALILHESHGMIAGLNITSESVVTIQSVPTVITSCFRQLDEYFSGTRTQFDVPLLMELGTEFEQATWNILTQIPHGQTFTYQQVAVALNKPTSARAVGRACGKNPFLILVPCHRVVGANGALTGFNAGIEKKAWLLNFEKHRIEV